MSFFGFDTTLDRELHKQTQDENIAVYTYGEEGYDGLADALDERLDEHNDETFGGDAGALSTEFDFTAQTLPENDLPKRVQPFLEASKHASQPSTNSIHVRASPANKIPTTSAQAALESMWVDRTSGASTHTFSNDRHVSSDSLEASSPDPNSTASRTFSPFDGSKIISPHLSHPQTQPAPKVRTLAEIEAEQRVAAQLARISLSSPPPPQRQSPHADSPHQQEYRPSPLIQHAASSIDREGEQERILRLQQQRQLLLGQDQLQQQILAQQQQRILAQKQLVQRQQQQRHVEFLQQQQLRIREHQERELLAQQQQLLQQQRSSLLTPQQHQQQQVLQQQLQSAQSGLPRTLGGYPILDRQFEEVDAAGLSLTEAQKEALMNEAMEKIVEAERHEEKRRRRMMKIAQMSKYNDLMTRSDKDFITRIQVSQLVTDDPWGDDYYAQMLVSLQRSRLGTGENDTAVVQFGTYGGIGVGLPLGHKGAGRKENALNRMATQVERIVKTQKTRESQPQAHLQGTLGRISGRSHKAAPRQLLQVDGATALNSDKSFEDGQGAAKEAARQGRDALADASGAQLVRKEPLTRHEVLVALERLYDTVIQVELLRRAGPPHDDLDRIAEWNEQHTLLIEEAWTKSLIMAPLETSDPHPFISLLGPAKGKRLISRMLLLVDQKRISLSFTLLVACYSQLDVVHDAYLLDQLQNTPQKKEAEIQNDLFFGTVFQTGMTLVRTSSLRFVTGMLGLLLESGNIVSLARTKAGLSLLTMLLSRTGALKQVQPDTSDAPTPEELVQWQIMFDHLIQFLDGNLLSLFPSIRIAASVPHGLTQQIRSTPWIEVADQTVWQFLATLAVCSSAEQQQHMVAEVREKVLENVISATKGWVTEESERQVKLDNVNLFLHALGLDSSQITV